MAYRWRGGGLAAAFLIVVGALVLGPWSASPASAEKMMRGSIAKALEADGYVLTIYDGIDCYFSIDSEGAYQYPGSIPDTTSAGYPIIRTLYFRSPYSAQSAYEMITDGSGELVFTRASDTVATTPAPAPSSVSATVTPSVASSPTTNSMGTPASPLRRLALLLIELEQNIKYEAQAGNWHESRFAWTAQVNDASAPNQLTEALQALELSLKSSVLAEDWNTRRVGWYASLRKATTPAAVADLMQQLELAITWDASEPAWRDRRGGWVHEVIVAGAGNATPAPSAPATTAPARPAPAATSATTVSRADTSAIARVAELLTSLESSVKPESIVSQWATERIPWSNALQRAAAVADLKTALQNFEVSIKRSALFDSWSAQRTAWYTALRAATTPAHVAVQLRQLERELKRDAMDEYYYWLSQGDWRMHVDEVANGTYSAPAAPAPTASASAVGGDLTKLATLLQDLENATMYHAQLDTWSSRRAAWVAAVKVATTVARFRESLLAYEASLKPEAVAMSSADPRMTTPRAGWREEVRVAATAARLAELLKQLEAALVTSSVAAEWPGLRAAWVAEVNAAGTGVAASPVPSTSARTIVAIDYEDTIAGHGNARYPDGTRYEGSFRDGVRHGYGVFYAANGSVAYEGYWGRDARLNNEPNHFKTGCDQFARGEYAGAIASLNRATVADPRHVEAYQKLVDAYVAVNDTQNARATLGRLRENNPRWSARNEVYFSMQEMLIEMDEVTQWL